MAFISLINRVNKITKKIIGPIEYKKSIMIFWFCEVL